MALKLIFMGTPYFAVPILKSLHESDHTILTVYTQPPKKSKRGQKVNSSQVQDFSKENNISFMTPDQIDKNEIQKIKKLNPDVVIVAAYGKILPSKLLQLNNIKFLNVHASLLPKWRGAAPIQRALMQMDSETGISIMKIISKLDAGPYFLQEKIKIEDDDNFITLSEKLSTLGSKLILQILELLDKKKDLKLVSQDENKVTYAKKIEKKETEIKFDLPAKFLVAKIKALNPYPGVWFNHRGNRLRIIEAIEVKKTGKEGRILDDNLTIGCKENAIQIKMIQKEGKKVLKTKDFLSGYKIDEGENLIE